MRIGLVAGEASGDLLGAGLIRAIREQMPDAEFEGVAGPAMLEAGCDQWEEADALAVFGLIEPIRHIPRLLRLRRSLARRWRSRPPDVFVGIDAPDFTLGLEKALRQLGIPTVHYVSPSIWVWRSGRIETVRKAADRVLCILPFEKRLYDDQGIDAVFVGHPKADELQAPADRRALRDALGLGDSRLIAVLPGSRSGEIERMGPQLAATAAIVAGRCPDVSFVTPIASPRLEAPFREQLEKAGIADRFTLIDGRSIETMGAADLVLLTSGTAALEASLLGRPTVAAYAIAAFGAWIVRRIGLKNRFFTIPNLIADEALIPEFIQEDVEPEAMAGAITDLLDDPDRCAEISSRFAKLRKELALGSDARAAEAVLELATR